MADAGRLLRRLLARPVLSAGKAKGCCMRCASWCCRSARSAARGPTPFSACRSASLRRTVRSMLAAQQHAGPSHGGWTSLAKYKQAKGYMTCQVNFHAQNSH